MGASMYGSRDIDIHLLSTLLICLMIKIVTMIPMIVDNITSALSSDVPVQDGFSPRAPIGMSSTFLSLRQSALTPS